MKIRIPLLLGTAGLMAVTACAPTDPYGDTSGGGVGGLNRAQTGALAGAAIGGILGATRDSDKNNQGRDAARGAILGAAIENTPGSGSIRAHSIPKRCVLKPSDAAIAISSAWPPRNSGSLHASIKRRLRSEKPPLPTSCPSPNCGHDAPT